MDLIGISSENSGNTLDIMEFLQEMANSEGTNILKKYREFVTQCAIGEAPKTAFRKVFPGANDEQVAKLHVELYARFEKIIEKNKAEMMRMYTAAPGSSDWLKCHYIETILEEEDPSVRLRAAGGLQKMLVSEKGTGPDFDEGHPSRGFSEAEYSVIEVDGMSEDEIKHSESRIMTKNIVSGQ